MLDIRYHIVSIIAVFLALGIGILIGSTLVGNDILVGQQEKMVQGLEEEFKALRESQDKLSEENNAQDDIIRDYEFFGQAVVPPIVKSRLQGRKVAVISTGGQNVPTGLINALNASSAEVLNQTVVVKEMTLADPQKKSNLIAYLKADPQTDSDTLRSMLGARVGIMLGSGATPEDLTFLEQSGLLTISGIYNQRVDIVIIIGGSDDKNLDFSRSFDRGLIEQMLTGNAMVIGTEPSPCQESYMEFYQSYQISTVDDIDISPGQLSCIYALSGESGNYGIKDTAAKFMPNLPVDLISNEVIPSTVSQ